MRPPGEIHQALLDAARELVTPEQAPTLAELAHRAQVGAAVARRTVHNMHRHGALCKVRERRVPYRNRPVFEYAPADMVASAVGRADLSAVFSAWAT